MSTEHDDLVAWSQMVQGRIDTLTAARDRLRQTDDADDRGAYWRALDDVCALSGKRPGAGTT